jgi:hypothetical protein
MSEQIYKTKDGTRVRVTKGKQFPVRPLDAPWMKKIREEANNRLVVVRVKDGHELWGYTLDDLMPE